jgi:hypothetical protein
MASAPAPIFCIELRRLTDAYAWAVSEYLRLQSAKLAAIINGDTMTIDEQLSATEIAKDNAKYALLAHRAKHGCGE